MEALVLYESCTGNTALGAEIIEKTLERAGHKCVTARLKNADPNLIAGHDLYCIAIPVNAFGPLAPAVDFLKKIPELPGKPVFTFCTCGGWPGITHPRIALLLKNKGMAVLDSFTLFCPDNYPITRVLDAKIYEKYQVPTTGSLKKLVNFTGDVIKKADKHLTGADIQYPKYRVWPTPSLFSATFALMGGLRYGLGKRTVDPNRCNLCGICAETCPVSAISINHSVNFSKACIGCWGCFNMCPNNAISSSICSSDHYFKGLGDTGQYIERAGL